jgi:DNA-binding transcriptional MerR regulator
MVFSEPARMKTHQDFWHDNFPSTQMTDAASMMQDRQAAPARKADGAFKTISEVAEELDLPAHVLRFWETKFPQIQPLKRGGGRRYYRPADVELIARIRDLLHHQGYTIRGVQQLFRSEERIARQHTPQPPVAVLPGGAKITPHPVVEPANDTTGALPVARKDLMALRDELSELAEDLRRMAS